MNFVNKQISYFFPLRCFLNLIKFMSINFKLINLMLINFKLINFMSMNFVNKQISYFFSFRCFLMLFSAFWCFLVLMKFHLKKVTFFQLGSFEYLLVVFSAFWCFLCFFVLVKSYRKKKNRKFKTVLITSIIILLDSVESLSFFGIIIGPFRGMFDLMKLRSYSLQFTQLVFTCSKLTIKTCLYC